MLCLLFRSIPRLSMCGNFSKQQLQISRPLFLFNKKPERVILTDKSKYKTIYYFKYIRLHASLFKLKFIVPAVTVVLPLLHVVKPELQNIIAFGVVGFIQYLIIWFLLKHNRDIIGIISVNKGGEVEEIIISSVNEKGKRIDRRHKPEDLIVCGFANKINEILGFATIKDKQADVTYKINVHRGTLVDQETFLSTFGNPKTW